MLNKAKGKRCAEFQNGADPLAKFKKAEGKRCAEFQIGTDPLAMFNKAEGKGCSEWNGHIGDVYEGGRKGLCRIKKLDVSTADYLSTRRSESYTPQKTSITRQWLSKHVLAATDDNNNGNAGGGVLYVVVPMLEDCRSWKI
jgi:hypothetical protein